MSHLLHKQSAHQEDQEVDLRALFHYFLENKWLILLITAIACALGFVYSSRQIPQYQSDILLQIENKTSNYSFANQGFAALGSGNPISTQATLIQSRFILKPVIESLGLNISAAPEKPPIWQRIFHQDTRTIKINTFNVPFNKVNQAYDLVYDKPNHIRVSRNKKLIIQGELGHLLQTKDKQFQLNVRSVHAPLGTHFTLTQHSAVSLIDALESRIKIEEAKTEMGSNTGIVLVKFTGPDAKQTTQLLDAIAAIAQMKDAEKKSQEASQVLGFLYQQLPITKHEMEKAEAALNQYRAKSGKFDIKIQAQFLLGQLGSLDLKLSEVRIKRIEMLQQYTAIHPVILALDLQKKSLEIERTALEKRIKTLPAADQVAVNLSRDVHLKEGLYLVLLKKIQELQVVKAGTVSSIRILAPATVPEAPLPSQAPVIYLASLVLGLLLSAVIVFSRKLLSPRVDDPHWSERQFNVANLAIIPFCKEQAEHSLKLKTHLSNDFPLLAHHNPRNLSIESLRSLRTSLQVGLLSARNNIVSILGISPGVGKTFVSSNLAYLLAAAGKRVLLVDCDLRRGTIHKYFNLQPSPGCSDVLTHAVSLEEAIQPTMIPNFFVLPRGAYPKDPSELMMSEDFKVLIQNLSQGFDLVVIDTAPILLVTDAVLVAGLAATNYLVVGAGAHQPAEFEMVLKRLASSSVTIQGTVFNFHRARTLTQSYGAYYGKYGRYHTYYYDESSKSKET